VFVDPFDDCPEGFGISISGSAYINGTVYDNSTNLTIGSVLVRIGSISNFTNGTGVYSMVVAAGNQSIVAIKTGYDPYINVLDIIIGSNFTFDIYLNPDINGTINAFFGNITGTVFDNNTGLIIANTTVAIADNITSSNGTGQFFGKVLSGTWYLVGIKSGYNTFSLANVSINAGNTTYQNISMFPLSNISDSPGGISTVQGFVIDNSTDTGIDNATVSIQGLTISTSSTGFYNTSATEGNHTIAAFKSSFITQSKTANVPSNGTLEVNFTLNRVVTEVLEQLVTVEENPPWIWFRNNR